MTPDVRHKSDKKLYLQDRQTRYILSRKPDQILNSIQNFNRVQKYRENAFSYMLVLTKMDTTMEESSVKSSLGFFKLGVLLEDSIKLGVLLEDTTKTINFLKDSGLIPNDSKKDLYG